MPKKLETMMTTPMESLKFIVSGLLPQGLHVLAGSPKIGKSWLSLWICLQVAKGEKIWEFETLQSEVLHLCLEDSFTRIQSRLFEITDEAPPTLHFAIMSSTIGSGLEMQIEDFLKEHPRTRLIVIDTLQKVRNTVSANVNPYAADYDDINALKQITDKYCIAIVLVHHLRKTGDADPLNMISGTSGIAGGADSNFVLQKDKRTENTAILICTGRDIEGRELFLEFNRYTFVWVLLSPIAIDVLIIPDELFLLSDFIKSQASFTGTATELAKDLHLELKPAILKRKIVKHMAFLNKNGISYWENRTPFRNGGTSLMSTKKRRLSIKLTQENWEKIHHKAEQSRKNLTDYVTHTCLGKEIVIITNLAKVLKELKAVGRN